MALFSLIRSENFDEKDGFQSLDEIRRWVGAICSDTQERAAFTPDRIVDGKSASARVAFTTIDSSTHTANLGSAINYDCRENAKNSIDPLSTVHMIEFDFKGQESGTAQKIRIEIQEILAEGHETTHVTLFFSRPVFDPNAGKDHPTRFTTLKVRNINGKRSFHFSKHTIDADVNDTSKSVTFELAEDHLQKQMLVGSNQIRALLQLLLPPKTDIASLQDQPHAIGEIALPKTKLDQLKEKLIEELRVNYGLVDCAPRVPGSNAKSITVLSTANGEVEIIIMIGPHFTEGVEIFIEVNIPADLPSQGNFRNVNSGGKSFLSNKEKPVLANENDLSAVCKQIMSRANEGIKIINGNYSLLLPIEVEQKSTVKQTLELESPKPRAKNSGYVRRVGVKKRAKI